MNTKVINLKPSSERELHKFSQEEARGYCIDGLRQIEQKINRCIIDYFKPFDEQKFQQIVLNSSLLNIESKLKILKNISIINNKVMAMVRKLVSIRNGFAHAPINQHITVVIDSKNTKDSKAEVETKITTMSSDGTLRSENAYVYLCEFYNLYQELRNLI